MVNPLFEKGWMKFPVETAVQSWAERAHEVARMRVRNPEEQAQWLECEGTWFVGVDTLPNDETGAVAGSGPLVGAAYDTARAMYGDLPLHRGQVSVMYPGYPRPRAGEGEAAFRYRRNRDAAHVDGLLGLGQPKQRLLKEPHAYILGLPLNHCSADASPLVIWEGSHEIMRDAFASVLGPLPEARWEDVDLTEIYQATRRTVFEECPRVEVTGQPGEAYLLHRLTLHGVAPWGERAVAPEDGRMIAYFRPEFPSGSRAWLERP